MSSELIKYAFVSGVLTPTLLGRVDFEKYDLGLAEGKNFFVDYRGGLSNRTGTEFGDFVQNPLNETKFVPFRYSPGVGDTFVVLFGEGYIRFIQDNGYVLEAEKTLTAVTTNSPALFTSAGHGFSVGNLVRLHGLVGPTALNDRTFIVSSITTDTFNLVTFFGPAVSTVGLTAFSSGKVSRVFTIVSPYNSNDLPFMKAHQEKNTLMLTHPSYPPYQLTRSAGGVWSLAQYVVGNTRTSPGLLSGLPSSAATAGVAFSVTSVGFDGEESRITNILLNELTVNYTTTAGSFLLTWTAVADTQFYNVYRSNVVPIGTDITKGAQLGYLGRATGLSFTDNNIVPNFTITPPQHYDPFANGGVSHINVTAGGTGYTKASVVTVTGTGVGFTGYPIVDALGQVTAIVVTSAGVGYITPTVSVSIGTGFTGTVTLTPISGNYPAESAVFQQRQVFASTFNQPLTLWASRPGLRTNFDNSRVVVDSDSYEFEIEVPEVTPISHLVPMRGGLLIMTQAGIWQLAGTGGGAVTPTNALADPQSFGGVSNLPPLKVDSDLLYVEGKGATVRMLAYSDISKVYGGTDVSILSNHFFGPGRRIVAWAFAQEPFKVVQAVREDGVLLSFTTVKEQNIYAWTENTTKGLYRDVCAVQEGSEDVAYYAIERFLAGGQVKTFERSTTRNYSDVEDAMFVDSGLRLPVTAATGATLQPAAATGTGIAFNTDVNIFSAGNVGYIIRCGGGMATITSYVNQKQVICTITRPILQTIPEHPTNKPYPFESGNWYLEPKVSTVGGLWHLEGESVKVLEDGERVTTATVTNGSVTLSAPSTRVVVGIPYRSLARSLPITVGGNAIEGRRKRVSGLAFRVNESKGVKWGARLTELFAPKFFAEIPFGGSVRLFTGMSDISIEPQYDKDGQIYFVQDDPLPATLLGYVLHVDVGDDPD